MRQGDARPRIRLGGFVSADSPNCFDLEDPASLARLAESERIGVGCKRADAPTLTPSIRNALTDLKLDQLIVVYPVERHYRLDKRVEVVPLVELVGAT